VETQSYNSRKGWADGSKDAVCFFLSLEKEGDCYFLPDA